MDKPGARASSLTGSSQASGLSADEAVCTPFAEQPGDRIGWRRRQGIGDCANQFHYYRLTMDNRIVWGGYDAVYHFGRKVDDRYEDRAATYQRLAAHFFITFPALDDVRFTHRWAGAIDTNTRFCAHWGLARDGRVAYVNGFTGLGVAATRFAARAPVAPIPPIAPV